MHGQEVLQNGNPKAAICSDCHTTHDVQDTSLDSTRLLITKNCGNCHTEELKSYTSTYHGQDEPAITTLGGNGEDNGDSSSASEGEADGGNRDNARRGRNRTVPPA